MKRISVLTLSCVTFLSLAGLTAAAAAPVEPLAKLKTLSEDPYTNKDAYHRTELGPDSYSWGKTIVSVFQTGRFPDGGATNIGFATSLDKGETWTDGFMPATTEYAEPPGNFTRVSTPSIAYDAKHDVWLSLAAGRDPVLSSLFVNRSEDGGLSWSDPVIAKASSETASYAFNWVSCDNWRSSPRYGTCYGEASNTVSAAVMMIRSRDGGKTWEKDQELDGYLLDGKPISQPDGTVVVPFLSDLAEVSMVSRDGGKTYDGPYPIASLGRGSGEVPFMRTGPDPTVETDADGTVYVAWQACEFRVNCAQNDILISSSENGMDWTDAARVPIDSVHSTVDHFLPALTIDPATSGASAHLALSYYFIPNDPCKFETCELYAGFVSSTDGGSSWSEPRTLLGPISLASLPNTSDGRFVGDYTGNSMVGRKAHPVLVQAEDGTCTVGKVKSCDEYIVTVKKGLKLAGGDVVVEADEPVFPTRPPGAVSRQFSAQD